MQVRHVIAAVKIIIDKDFPVAVQAVATALDPVKVCETQTLKLIDQIGSQKIVVATPLR